ncbi:MAG: Maf family protein [Ignavibacteriaceae bacterium]|nr:septum formation protein Maf [Ignavibacteriales bacterium]MEB2330376.1 Maf family protein [Ignavibacteriaceae bacterium]
MNPSIIYKRKYILASKSERRINLLQKIGLDFRVIPSDIEELEGEDMRPLDVIRFNSLAKSRNVAFGANGEIVIGADTVVVLDGKIIYKPENYIHAKKILLSLSGRKHHVYTGFNLIDTKSGDEIFNYEKTSVHFRDLTEREINYYLKYHKPFDKAGAYGIQDDFGCFFIEKINGDFYNVVGLPLQKVYMNLMKLTS